MNNPNRRAVQARPSFTKGWSRQASLPREEADRNVRPEGTESASEGAMLKRIYFLLALLAVLGTAYPGWSQETAPYPVPVGGGRTAMPAPVPSPLGSKAGGDVPTTVYPNENGNHGLSDYITYRNGCGRAGCFSNGFDPPIGTEIYLRSGLTFPFGGDLFGDILGVGWNIQGGGKTLFFDDAYVRPWFVDISLGNFNNRATSESSRRPFQLIGQNVTVRDYNRTFVGLGVGQHWYLSGNGLEGGVRLGLDGGGRWGSASVRLTNLQHQTDVVGGIYVGGQIDWETPMNCSDCFLVLGLRGEWDYTWSDILDRTSDVSGFNLMFHMGVRY